MLRSVVRLTILVLAVFGAPIATHLLIHDLVDHSHPAHAAELEAGEHAGHEHPVTVAARPHVAASLITVPPMSALLPASPRIREGADGIRNIMAAGALRLDDDVGAQALLSTFRI